MTWKETKSYSETMKKKRIHEVVEWVENKLADIYEEIELAFDYGHERCFLLPDGTVIHVVGMIGEKFNDIVVEYSQNMEQKRKMDTEDGDLFPIDDPEEFESPDDMFNAILEEIRS